MILARIVFASCALALALAGHAAASEKKAPHGPPGGWSFSGFFGRYERDDLQRGFQVYKEVCASCHGMTLLAFRALGEPGGPGFSEAAVKVIASEFQVPAEPTADEPSTHDDLGQLRRRPGKPSDVIPSPFENELRARAANGGAAPPDLSVMTKARMGGADYVYSLLTGYEEAPADMEMRTGMSYNPFMSGGQIAMPPQLVEGRVTYEDGTEATPEQMAKDVTTFLAWAAEPELEQRKRMGFMVLAYLAILTGLLYLAYRRVWRGVGH